MNTPRCRERFWDLGKKKHLLTPVPSVCKIMLIIFLVLQAQTSKSADFKVRILLQPQMSANKLLYEGRFIQGKAAPLQCAHLFLDIFFVWGSLFGLC